MTIFAATNVPLNIHEQLACPGGNHTLHDPVDEDPVLSYLFLKLFADPRGGTKVERPLGTPTLPWAC